MALTFVVLLALSTLVSVLALRALLHSRLADRVADTLAEEHEQFDREKASLPNDASLEGSLQALLRENPPGQDEGLFAFVEGRLVEQTFTGPSPLILAREEIAALGRGTARRTGEIPTAIGPLAYDASAVEVGGERGMLVATNSLIGERAEVDESVLAAGLVGTVVATLAALLAVLAAGRVLQPMRQFQDVAAAASESNLSLRIPVTGDDEFNDIARHANAMFERLERAFGVQREFINDVGHELRTPITIIRGHLELMGDDAEDRQETVAIVLDELNRMTRFVNDLLLLTKAEAPEFLRLETIHLATFTEELATKARALAPRAWRLDCAGSGIIVADRQRLTQAMMNLAQNAVEHTKDGDEIAIGTASSGGEARMWVRDRGSGIALDAQQRIFDRFSRAGAGRLHGEGAGLGLAIVRAIVDAHGGRVELVSSPGEGSTFTIDVPSEPPSRKSRRRREVASPSAEHASR